MAAKAKKIQPKKIKIEIRQKLVQNAMEIMSKGGPKTKPQLATCIAWKKKVPMKKVKGKVDELRQQWEREFKNCGIPTERHWTDEHEYKLQNLLNGDISKVKDTILYKQANARKCTFLDQQLQFVSSPERMDLLLSAYQSLSSDTWQEFKRKMELIDDGHCFESTCCNFDYDEEAEFVIYSSSDDSLTDFAPEAQPSDIRKKNTRGTFSCIIK